MQKKTDDSLVFLQNLCYNITNEFSVREFTIPEGVIYMSRCVSLASAGLSGGIPVTKTGSSSHPHCVNVGRYFGHDHTQPEPLLRSHDVQVFLDRFRPPALQNGWLTQASVIEANGLPYLRTSYPNQRGVLVHIDTSHTEPCDVGGYWEILGGNPRVIAQGKRGHHIYEVRHRGGLFGDPFSEVEPVEEVDTRGCYATALLLLMPGDSLKVVFHAPGEVVGNLWYNRRTGLRFQLSKNEFDQDYELPYRNYQEEQDLSDDLARMERERQVFTGGDW